MRFATHPVWLVDFSIFFGGCKQPNLSTGNPFPFSAAKLVHFAIPAKYFIAFLEIIRNFAAGLIHF